MKERRLRLEPLETRALLDAGGLPVYGPMPPAAGIESPLDDAGAKDGPDIKAQCIALQATAQEGAVTLNWSHTGFSPIDGFNVYRSDSAGGTYTLLTVTSLDASATTYTDSTATVGTASYYKVAIISNSVETDSNIAAAVPYDATAPVIVHTPVTESGAGAAVTISATITDNLDVDSVSLFYRELGSSGAYTEVTMSNGGSGNVYSEDIPAAAVTSPGVEYYIVANDGFNTTTDGSTDSPHEILVDIAPTISSLSVTEASSEGGTNVTVTGTNFRSGASVLFGSAPASNVVVVSDTEITCDTPPHYPGLVDVTVINADDTEATLWGGFVYQDTDAAASLPDLGGIQGDTLVVPLEVANVDGLFAATVSLTYNSSVLSLDDIDAGPLAGGWSVSSYPESPDGSVTVALANETSVTGSGAILHLSFSLIGSPGTSSTVSITSMELNGAALDAGSLSDGSISIGSVYEVSGTATYYKGDRALPGVALSMNGLAATTDMAGDFAISSVNPGGYTLTPSKSDDVDEITSLDASYVLQKVVGMRTLDTHETTAADVDNSGSVTSMDASYILMKSVGLLNTPFPGQDAAWVFSPASRSVTVSADVTGQDFTGILIGDVTGNWGTTPETKGIKGGDVIFDLGEVGTNGGQVVVPVEAQFDADATSFDFVVKYDAKQLSLQDVVLDPSAGQLEIAVNGTVPGEIRVAAASISAIDVEGTLLNLVFDCCAPLTEATELTFDSLQLDEGAVSAQVGNGLILPAGLPGDLNLDGHVGSADLDIVRTHWGDAVSAGDFLAGDPSGDGVVNSDDLNIVRANWGTIGAASAKSSPATRARMADAVFADHGVRPSNEPPTERLAGAAWLEALAAIAAK